VQFPDLFLIVAPRHVERAPEVRRTLERLGLRVVVRSQLPIIGRGTVDCLLLDSTGELRNWYPVATVAFIGKSLTAHGGQNPVEPIIAGKPVVFGPHMENFATLARALVTGKGAIKVQDADSLELAIEKLLRDNKARQSLVDNARQILGEHTGATSRTAGLVVNLRP